MSKMTPWDFFDCVFFINLPHRRDRKEQAMAEFEKVGLSEKVKLIYGEYNEKDGRVGLQKTLLDLFNHAYWKKMDRVLIFEDDVQFINDPIHKLKLALNDLKYSFDNKFDLLYFGATRTEPCMKVTNNLILLKGGLAAHAICYNHTVFEKYIKHLRRVVRHGYIATDADISDVFLASEIQPKGNSYMIYPVIATQRPGYSDIEHRNTDYSFIHKSTY